MDERTPEQVWATWRCTPENCADAFYTGAPCTSHEREAAAGIGALRAEGYVVRRE